MINQFITNVKKIAMDYNETHLNSKETDEEELLRGIKDKLNLEMTKLQSSENQYYQQLTFFPEWRKSHSTLQPLIEQANRFIAEFNLEDSQQVKYQPY